MLAARNFCLNEHLIQAQAILMPLQPVHRDRLWSVEPGDVYHEDCTRLSCTIAKYTETDYVRRQFSQKK